MSIYRDELFNPNTENPNLFELDILKDRIAGGTGQSVDLFFNKQTGRLYPVYTSVAEPGNG
jgi:replicative DNA helicase